MNISSHRCNDWLADRRWRMFWRCVPALLAGGAALLVFAVVIAGDGQRSALRLRYHRTVAGALAARDFETARVACLRGLSFDSDEQSRLQWLFQLSIALNGLGRASEATALLATAAPEDRPGCVPAHLTVAQMLLNSTNVTPEAIRSAERQLQNALALEPQSLEINEMLGRLYINTSRFAQARKCLMEVYRVKKDVALLLAITSNASHDLAAAKSWADVAIDVFTRNLKQADPEDSSADRIGLAQAFSLQENYAEALKTLESGVALSGDRPYGLAIADVCAAWAGRMAALRGSDERERLRLIRKGLNGAPQQSRLWLLLIQTARLPGDSGREAKVLVDQLAAEAKGESAALWHFFLWTDAREAGDNQTASRHLRQAYQLAPHIPQIVNDMAMELAFGADPNPERALSIIEPVSGRFADTPAFRDTRGRVLVKLGRYQEAVGHLEFASSRLAGATASHLALATAYEALGRPESASAQRQLAGGRKSIEKKL